MDVSMSDTPIILDNVSESIMNDGKARYTRNFRPWKLIYYEAYSDRSIAQEREKKLKQHGKRYSAILNRFRKEEN